ncbi:MAG: hypothetical protein IKS37_11850 [Solobacterium sp.]|nr:hypothetical protein [Solobacterium sp.]
MFQKFLARLEKKDMIMIVCLIVFALLSLTVLRNYFTSEGYTAPRIAYLDEKKGTVMELAAVSTTASAAISAIPGDAGTPISEKLADLSTYSLIVICALFLEKYLLALTGDVVFMVIIPLACILGIIYYAGKKKNSLMRIAIKVAAVGMLLQFVVPTSIYVSEKIEETYQSSITETIENAKESSEEIQENAQTQTLWDKFVSGIAGGITGLTERLQKILNNLIEGIAVMIVTSCLIPIVVMMFFSWIIKAVIGETNMADQMRMWSMMGRKPNVR